jgi:AraC-like DNA-binding protein
VDASRYHVTTAGQDGVAGFDLWHDEVRTHITPIDIHVPDRASFSGEFRHRRLGHLDFSAIKATRQDARHEARGQHGPAARFDLVYMRTGGISMRQDSREVVIGAGEALLFSHLDDFTFSTTPYSECYLLACPEHWIERWLPDPHACSMRSLVLNSRWSAAITGLLDGIGGVVEGDLPAPGELLAEQLGGCLALICEGLTPQETTHRRRLIRDIRRTLYDASADTDLAAGTIAAQHGISVRYLHALFASSGTSIGRELRTIRLARARAMLEDPAQSGRSIAEISYACGFNDPAYLARCFTRAFGQAPRHYRGRDKADRSMLVAGS